MHTSIALTNWLLENNITAVGTLNTTRIGVPDEVKKSEGRDEFSATCHFEAQNGNLCLNSYTVKTKSKDKKNVLLLRTMRPLHKKTKDDKQEKPAIYKLYDFTKGGTDIVDQMNDCYPTRAKTLRWSTLGFYYMLDTIRVNSKFLWYIKHGKDPKKDNTFDLGLDLAHSLVMPFIQQRSLVGLRKPLLKKINYI